MRKFVPMAPFAGLFLAVLALGGALRVARLADRPMHTDEAVQAVKFGELLENGHYRYDPAEYHGPTLYYFTLPPVRLAGIRASSGVDEVLLRSVPVAFGLGLILLLPLLRDGLGKAGILTAALLTAVSPILVYYSRYYIQETLLAFFTLGAMGCGWSYVVSSSSSPSPSSAGEDRGRRTRTIDGVAWSLLAGLFLGLMHATKETAVIPIVAWVLALAGMALYARRLPPLRPLILPAAVAGLVAVSVSALFYSSMFTHARGPLDSILAYFNFAERAGGQGHEKPWTYYLSILAWHREAGYRSSELVILVLAVLGGLFSFAARGTGTTRIRLGRFLALYCALLFAAYSIIPYKTPWLMVGFIQGAILLAATGVAEAWDRCRLPALRALLVLILLAGAADLGRQAWIGSTRYGADARNPYAYAHTSTDCLRLVDRLEDLAAMHPDGPRMLIKVMAEEYWPLPWYLRGFERVGYWNEVAADCVAPVVITSPALAGQVETCLGEGYVTDLYGLRPGVFLVAYIREDLWNRLIGVGEPEARGLNRFAHVAMGTESGMGKGYALDRIMLERTRSSSCATGP